MMIPIDKKQIGIRLINISHAVKELLSLLLMRFSGMEHKRTDSDRIVWLQRHTNTILAWNSMLLFAENVRHA